MSIGCETAIHTIVELYEPRVEQEWVNAGFSAAEKTAIVERVRDALRFVGYTVRVKCLDRGEDENGCISYYKH